MLNHIMDVGLKTFLFATIFVISGGFFSGIAFAQTASSLDLNAGVWINPSFQVGTISVTKNATTGVLTGTADVLNDNDAAFGGIRMQALLMDPAANAPTPNTISRDNARIIDRFVFADSYSFAPHEKKTISFSYTPP